MYAECTYICVNIFIYNIKAQRVRALSQPAQMSHAIALYEIIPLYEIPNAVELWPLLFISTTYTMGTYINAAKLNDLSYSYVSLHIHFNLK